MFKFFYEQKPLVQIINENDAIADKLISTRYYTNEPNSKRISKKEAEQITSQERRESYYSYTFNTRSSRHTSFNQPSSDNCKDADIKPSLKMTEYAEGKKTTDNTYMDANFINGGVQKMNKLILTIIFMYIIGGGIALYLVTMEFVEMRVIKSKLAVLAILVAVVAAEILTMSRCF